MSDITLQINLSPGDLSYARLTVPALVAAHPSVAERLLVVDFCRPQRTKLVEPDQMFPLEVYNGRVEAIRAIVDEWRERKLFDRVEILLPGSPLFPGLAARYTRGWMRETHDYAGCAFMAYWAAIDLPRTRFLLHYDADMLLHQDPGYDWAPEARSRMLPHATVLAATPRVSPPGFAASPERDGPSQNEGRPFTRTEGGWLNDWFSTRCLLLDREKLAAYLPLLSTRDALGQRFKQLIARGYPAAPEIILFRGLGGRGAKRLNLDSPQAWILHPTTKPPAYLELLPRIFAAVQAGRVPEAQRGNSEINVAAWSEFLTAHPHILPA